MLEGSVGVIVPILTGVFEQSIRIFTSFSVLMLLAGCTIILVMNLYESLMLFTDRGVIGNNIIYKKVGINILNNIYVRRCFVIMASFLCFAGMLTFGMSVFGGRV